MTPNDRKNRPGDVPKSMKNSCCSLGCALGALGASRGTPPTPKVSENSFFHACHTSTTIALLSFSRNAYEKIHAGFLPQGSGFKHWRCFCPPRAPAKKLAVVPSLQTVFQKMPMAPTFLSSSNARRHNNARPPPVHTLLSAAAERSSSGFCRSLSIFIETMIFIC